MSPFRPDHLLSKLRRSLSAAPSQIVGLSSHGAAWNALGPTRQAQWQQVSWSDPSAALGELSLTSLVETLAPASGSSIHWVLAPSLIRHWLQSPPAHTASLSELHAVAQARATQQFGANAVAATAESGAADWTVAADWHATQPFLCAAIAPPLHQALQVASRGTAVILSPLRLTLSQCQRQLPRQGWLALALLGEFHVLQIADGRARRLRSVRVAPETSAAELELRVVQEWQRERLRALSDDGTLHWLNLDPSAAAEPVSPALKPLRWPVTRSARATTQTPLPVGPVSEAMQVAWCGQVLLAGNPA